MDTKNGPSSISNKPLEEEDLIRGNELFMQIDEFLLGLYHQGKITREDGDYVIMSFSKIVKWDPKNYEHRKKK